MTRSPLLRRKLRRDLRRQAGPTGAVVVTVLLGVALFGAAYDAFRNLQGSYDRTFEDLRVADIWITGGDTPAIASAISELDGVEQVVTRVQADVPMRVGGQKLSGRVVGLAGEPVMNDVQLLGGHRPGAAGDGTDPPVAAEDHLADEFDLGPGDAVEVLVDGTWTALEVTGSASSAEYLWLARNRQEIIAFPDEFGVVFAPERVAEAIAGSSPNQVLIRTAPGRATASVMERVEPLARDHGAIEAFTRADQPSNAALSEDIDGFSQMALLFPLLFLTAAGLASYTLLSRRVRTETPVVGMLRAQGVGRAVVLRHYLTFGVATGVAGAVPGILLGLWLARAMTRLYVEFLSIPITAVSFHPETVVIGVAFGVVAGGLAALAPARAAASIPPAEAMRGVVPATGGGRSVLERLVPFSSRLPASARLVLRSITRNRRRTAMTVGGVVLSLLLVLVSWSLLDTVEGSLDAQFDDRNRSDAQVSFGSVVGPDAVGALAAVEGVAVAEPIAELPVSVRTDDGAYGTLLDALPTRSRLRHLEITAGDDAGVAAGGLFVGEALEGELGLDVGDTVEVVATDGHGRVLGTLRAPISGFVHETLGTRAFTSLDELAGALGTERPPVTGALVGFEAGADDDVMRQRIEALDLVAEYRSTDSLRELLDDTTALLVGFVTLMLVVGGVLAAAMMFTTVSVSIAERRNEVATLRASGVPLRRIARLVTSENLLVAALGVGPGVVLGILGGRLMLATYTTDQFSFEHVVAPRTILASVAAVMVVAGLSQVPGLRALRRLDLAQTVRERSA